MSNIDLTRAFFDAWKTCDPDTIAALMTEDCFYHNVPMEPVVGRTAITAFLRDFLGDAQTVVFDVLAIAETTDGTVLTERIDHFDFGGRTFALPVMGSLQFRGGLVSRWLDYFDMGPINAATAS